MPSRSAVRIVDSSLLIEADHRKALGPLRGHLRNGPRAVPPQRVFHETVTEPRSLGHFGTSAARIEKLYVDGTITVENPDYADAHVSDTVDRVRECIARKAGKPVHMVERADLQIVALAASHARRGNAVEIIFRDRALKDCLESVLSARRISGVTLTDSSMLVRQLLSRRRM